MANMYTTRREWDDVKKFISGFNKAVSSSPCGRRIGTPPSPNHSTSRSTLSSTRRRRTLSSSPVPLIPIASSRNFVASPPRLSKKSVSNRRPRHLLARHRLLARQRLLRSAAASLPANASSLEGGSGEVPRVDLSFPAVASLLPPAVSMLRAAA
ncbi:hypothetical protein Cni_G16424 [Canna indica]|uniref:Uncharacterized protein n=1 Tax=Canna indica TaxID=4628 RepID=A0AAQ3KFB1_9LILI|nr:hypothetical protein Cni_G16424 [Canna indica]